MTHRATFNVTFRWGKMLQVFEIDLKTCIVARISSVASKIVSCNINGPLHEVQFFAQQVVPCNTALEVSTMRFRDDKQFYSD